MNNGWEVLDTAVKIGLGAIVTGVVTIWVTRIQLRGQSARELRQQRQQEWSRSMERVVAYRKSLYLFNEAAGDYLVNREERQLEADLDRQFGEAKARLADAELADLWAALEEPRTQFFEALLRFEHRLNA